MLKFPFQRKKILRKATISPYIRLTQAEITKTGKAFALALQIESTQKFIKKKECTWNPNKTYENPMKYLYESSVNTWSNPFDVREA